MERREKVDFILEQMRLCLAKKDYIRMQIISKKISIKFFESESEQVGSFYYHISSVHRFLSYFRNKIKSLLFNFYCKTVGQIGNYGFQAQVALKPDA